MTPELQKLVNQFTAFLETDNGNTDLRAVKENMDRISVRLDRIEKALASPVEQSPVSSHPSLQKFNIAEAIADQIFDKEKACQFEPGKPCDHCSMCSSRGF